MRTSASTSAGLTLVDGDSGSRSLGVWVRGSTRWSGPVVAVRRAQLARARAELSAVRRPRRVVSSRDPGPARSLRPSPRHTPSCSAKRAAGLCLLGSASAGCPTDSTAEDLLCSGSLKPATHVIKRRVR